jgi:translation initiation factor IF-1
MAKNRKNRNQQYASTTEPEEREDRLELEGTVEEALPGTLFQIRCANNLLVLCTLGGKLRMNRIRILPGDHVTIEVSPYDTSRGRITWRARQ